MPQIVGWPSASRLTGHSIAQLRRFAADGTLPLKKNKKGWCVFSEEDLLAIRKTPCTSSTASTAGTPGPADCEAAGPREEAPAGRLSGETSAAVFGDLESGLPLVAIAIKRQLPRAAVEQAVGDWTALKNLDVNAPSVPAAIESLKRRCRRLREDATADAESIATLEVRLDALEARVASMPLPTREDFKCPACGRQHWVAAKLECTACGYPTSHGFYPPK